MQKNQFQNNNDVEKVKERIDIVDFIGRYLHVKRAGRSYQALCPFHQEKTPSFSISPDMQRFKCFGCGKSGDVITFLMDYENLDFREALERLAKEAGVELTKFAPKKRDIPVEITQMINNFACAFFMSQLQDSENSHALKYFQERGFNAESIKKFKLGYAPKARSSLYDFIMKKAKFSDNQLVNSGLFVERYSSVTDKFFDRVMFPIVNQRGKVIGFTGRVLDTDDNRPKYLNSPETAIFKKNENVYGMYQARQQARRDDLCLLCEGSTDVISANQAGYENIVAPLGTSLTDGQISLIKKHTSNILVIFDSDEAGQKALERAFVLINKQGMSCYANNTGKYKDLDELIQSEPKKLDELIRNKVDAFTYLVSRKVQLLDSTKLSEYEKLINYVCTLLQSTDEKASLRFFINKASKLTGIDTEIIEDRLKKEKQKFKYRSNLAATSNRTSEQATKQIEQKLTLEDILIAYIIHQNKFAMIKQLNIRKKYFSSVDSRNTVSALCDLKDEATIEKLKEIDAVPSYYLERIMLLTPKELSNIEEMSEQELEQIYNRIKKNHYSNTLNRKKQLLSVEEEKPAPDKSTIKKLMNEISSLSRKIHKL